MGIASLERTTLVDFGIEYAYYSRYIFRPYSTLHIFPVAVKKLSMSHSSPSFLHVLCIVELVLNIHEIFANMDVKQPSTNQARLFSFTLRPGQF